MLVSGVSRGGDEIVLIQYRKVTKLNAKIPSLYFLAVRKGAEISLELTVHCMVQYSEQ